MSYDINWQDDGRSIEYPRDDARVLWVLIGCGSVPRPLSACNAQAGADQGASSAQDIQAEGDGISLEDAVRQGKMRNRS